MTIYWEKVVPWCWRREDRFLPYRLAAGRPGRT